MEINKFTCKCVTCQCANDPEEQKRIIYQDEFVRVALRADNQVWLARAVIVPHQHISPDQVYSEHPELVNHVFCRVIPLLNEKCRKLYGMSMANLAQLGNLTTDENGNKTSVSGYFHWHVHWIPRYETAPTILNQSFPDPQWGLALNLDPKAGLPVVKPSAELLAQIKADFA